MLRKVLSVGTRSAPRTLQSRIVASSSASSLSATVPHSRNPTSTSNNQSIQQRDYSVYAWGTNKNGVLLQSTSDSVIWEPHRPTTLEESKVEEQNVTDVVCGATDTAIILEDGSVYVCGTNKNGQLGLGHTNPVPSLTKIPNIPPISQVAFGPSMAALITKDEGDVYTCGFGGSLVSGMGCLGHGDGDSITEFKKVDSLVEDGCVAQDVECGESSMVVLTTEGEILTTGASAYGRLGNGETSVDSLYLEPVEVLQKATQIASGKSFTLALSPEGTLYGWGRNHKGQLGTGFGMAVDMYSMENVPVPIDSDELINRTVTKIAAGPNHSACVTSSGELFTWGMQLHLEPVRVNEVLHTKIVDVVCGNDYTMALSEDHHIYVWGKGKTGALGLGSSNKQCNQAQMIKSLVDDNVVKMSAGWAHAACLVEEKNSVQSKETE